MTEFLANYWINSVMLIPNMTIFRLRYMKMLFTFTVLSEYCQYY